jgi:hypothetical protein
MSPKQLWKCTLVQGGWGMHSLVLELIPTKLILFYFIRKTIVRGAVTNGREWTFLLLRSNTSTGHIEYLESKGITIMDVGAEGTSVISHQQCDLIVGIISYWASGLCIDSTILPIKLCFWQIAHSSEDIEGDDWFTLVTD